MKSKRMSLYIVSVVLLVIMILSSLGLATWALLSTKLDVSGNIGFTGTGDVLATISHGAVTGGTVTQKDGKTPLQQVDITAAGPSDSNSWTGLELVIADKTEPLVINFSVTNNHSEKNLRINVDVTVATDDNITISASTSEFGEVNPVVIAPGEGASYNITFTVGETNTILTRDFELVYNLTNTDAEASVEPGPEPTLDKLAFSLNADKASYSVEYRKGSEITGAVVIPGKYNDLPVTRIVYHGGGVATPEPIGPGQGAFANCSEITSIYIPASVIDVGYGSLFANCDKLTSITVARRNSKYHSDGNCLIETASKKLISGCSTSVIPTDGSVTSIADYAFAWCNGLTSITIPSSVTDIGQDAFCGCSSLTSITFEKTSGNVSIGMGAFDSTLVNVNFNGKTWTSGGTSYTASNIGNASKLNDHTWTIS